jgi:hypothetical protein
MFITKGHPHDLYQSSDTQDYAVRIGMIVRELMVRHPTPGLHHAKPKRPSDPEIISEDEFNRPPEKPGLLHLLVGTVAIAVVVGFITLGLFAAAALSGHVWVNTP